MKVISLQSGSNGNCIYVEAGGVRLLFDAGISAIQVEERLALHGRDVAVDAVLISHDHIDHCRNMGILNRAFGLPIYATAKTYEAAKRHALGTIDDLRHFQSGEKVKIGKIVVETIRTPHDAEDGVVFVVDDGKHRLGILTDLGHVFSGLADVIAGLDAVLLESNYDPDMLANGSYSEQAQKADYWPGWSYLQLRGRRASEDGCIEANEMGLSGPSFRGQQHAEVGLGDSPEDSGRPAAFVRGDKV